MISKTVRAYLVPSIAGAFTLDLPIGATLLQAVPTFTERVGDGPFLYALIDPIAATETRSFVAVEPEGDINDTDPTQLSPLGSVFTEIHLHLFEVL